MASLAIHRAWIPSGRPEGIAVDLVGTATAWTGSTTFTLAGVAGCSVATKIVNSGTAARLVVATGTATGTLTVSDGTNSATVAVRRGHRPRWIPDLDPY